MTQYIQSGEKITLFTIYMIYLDTIPKEIGNRWI
uniref:Uncharacterized protein n=1 Tax=virus sp. ctML55 TaxID=2827627 RepID=A0A8S5RID2_9VIRU|nr:MAG TPA: hypothetical protein [virus sp. ctML55]